MIVKKTGRLILGAKLTKDEEKALKIEVQKQIATYDRMNANEIDAMVLWVLHERFGFGKKRLRRFYEAFTPVLNALCERYEMTDKGDELWLCQEKFKDYGIDLNEWGNEST